ncbi:MAG: hypothetical protein AABX38_01230 [Candidatus Micrarchaeota archaeon]
MAKLKKKLKVKSSSKPKLKTKLKNKKKGKSVSKKQLALKYRGPSGKSKASKVAKLVKRATGLA